MKYSDKLNGFWEEGYHYYIEIRKNKMTVRGYRRDIELETEISYDAAALERGERTVITPADNVLSRTAAGEPFTMIRELYYENGELKLLYYYTITGETLYTLKKVDNGPFDHIKIRDSEFLKSLQGEWFEWRPGGKAGAKITIKRGRINIDGWRVFGFHVISRAYSPEKVYIVPENLIDTDFGAYTAFEVLPGMLTARMMITDVSVPLSAFVRADELKDLVPPADALGEIRNTMVTEND